MVVEVEASDDDDDGNREEDEEAVEVEVTTGETGVDPGNKSIFGNPLGKVRFSGTGVSKGVPRASSDVGSAEVKDVDVGMVVIVLVLALVLGVVLGDDTGV